MQSATTRTDDESGRCGCALRIAGRRLVIDAADCPNDGRLATGPACRETAIEAVTSRTTAVRILLDGGVAVHDEGAVGLLIAAARFAALVGSHDRTLAERTRRDPLGAARVALGRGGRVAELAATTGLAVGARRVAGYEAAFGNARELNPLTSAGSIDAMLHDIDGAGELDPEKLRARYDDRLRTVIDERGVEPGDRVAIGDPLGTLVRAGFFAPWVDNHVHLELRDPDANPYRASGSLALAPEIEAEALAWDGTGEVVETGDTYAVLDSPAHPAPGERFVGIASDAGRVLDGGLVHYAGGGAFGDSSGSVSLFGRRVGRADGRDVAWDPLEIRANGTRITGISLFCGRGADFGAKLIHPDHDFSVGDRIEVELRDTDDPIRLG